MALQLREEHRHYLPNQDWQLDKLYDLLPDLGVTVLQAIYSRYIEQYYRPYHQQLQQLLHQSSEQFGKVYLLDLQAYWDRSSMMFAWEMPTSGVVRSF